MVNIFPNIKTLVKSLNRAESGRPARLPTCLIVSEPQRHMRPLEIPFFKLWVSNV